MAWTTGPKNLITDVAGLKVGHAHDASVRTGTTVLTASKPFTAAVHVMGGGPGTRETDLLSPENTVDQVHALVLSGGSAFGLDAASGVISGLRQRGVGFAVGPHLVPIVPAAILFDLANGGDKDWGLHAPYRELGLEALEAAGADFALGTAGAGYGATTAVVKGGIGSASTVLGNGITIGALVAANPVGSPLVGATRHFWASPFEIGDEFGGLGLPHPMPDDAKDLRTKWNAPASSLANTTIAIIATDAALTKAEAKRLAIAAHDGFARAIWPVHTPLDGDLVFAASTGQHNLPRDAGAIAELGAAAASTMARAVARAVHAATPMDGDLLPAWRDLKG